MHKVWMYLSHLIIRSVKGYRLMLRIFLILISSHNRIILWNIDMPQADPWALLQVWNILFGWRKSSCNINATEIRIFESVNCVNCLKVVVHIFTHIKNRNYLDLKHLNIVMVLLNLQLDKRNKNIFIIVKS